MHQLLLVLHERAAHIADGGHSEAEHVGAGHHGVAHEIALQAACALGDRQLVGGQGEVVHTDGLIAGVHEAFACDGEQGELGVAAGHGRHFDLLLMAALIGQVRKRIDRDSVGPQRDGLGNGPREGLRRLPGQPVDKVDVHAGKAVLPRTRHQVFRR